MPTNANNITHEINIGRISQVLATTDINQKLMRNENIMDEYLPIKIKLLRKALQFGYVYDNGSAALDLVCDYMLALCGPYRAQAETELGNATGIIVGTGSGNNPNQLKDYRKYPQFIVGDAGAKPMGDGDTVLEIFDGDAAPGWVKAFVDEGEQGEGLSDRVSWTSVWEVGKITVTWNQGLKKGTLMNPEYPVTTNLTISSSSTQDLDYYATLNGVETKSLLSTTGNIFLIAINTTSKVGFDLRCTTSAKEQMTLVWEGLVYNDAGVITVTETRREVLASKNDFTDAFVTPPPDGTLIIAGDNTFQGLRITLTGITDKIINCVAQFTIRSGNL